MQSPVALDELLRLYHRHGCATVYAKPLARNDNSKNQIYIGTNLEFSNLLPNKGVTAPHAKILKAALDFYWMGASGNLDVAPDTQMIFYPQYPEVRLSGFKENCTGAPDVLAGRISGRTLFLGITNDGRILGHVLSAHELEPTAIDKIAIGHKGVWRELDIQALVTGSDSRGRLITALRVIHEKQWIDSKQLDSKGILKPCNATQCGGFTLEAELGIPKNSKSDPDFLGYEVKQHRSPNFAKPWAGGAITLMTPEPKLGYYGEQGVEAFVNRFGYADVKGRPDRMNFNGSHRIGKTHPKTGLTLLLEGYNHETSQVTNLQGFVALLTAEGEVAAGWSFAELMEHWTRKHNKAVYVPSMSRNEPQRQYCYGHTVRIADETSFPRLLDALACGEVYYDPGIKVEGASTSESKPKPRSQFRISSKNIPSLYRTVENVNLVNG